MVIILLADIAFFISGAAAVEGNELSTLHVSKNGRFIVRAVTKFTSSGFQEIEYPAGARG